MLAASVVKEKGSWVGMPCSAMTRPLARFIHTALWEMVRNPKLKKVSAASTHRIVITREFRLASVAEDASIDMIPKGPKLFFRAYSGNRSRAASRKGLVPWRAQNLVLGGHGLVRQLFIRLEAAHDQVLLMQAHLLHAQAGLLGEGGEAQQAA